MAQLFRHDFLAHPRKAGRFLLAIVLLSGYICGILVSMKAGNISSLMYAAVNARVSIVSLLLAFLLPFLLSAIAVYLGQPWLFLPIGFCKAFCFACVSYGIGYAYAGAGWLMRWLFMFSDTLTMPLLCYFWLSHMSGSPRNSPAAWFWILSASLFIGYIDFRFIAPILAVL